MNSIPDADVVLTPSGVKYILFSGTDRQGITQCIRESGEYEGNLKIIANALLDIRPANGCVVDIGANLGSFTIPLARRYPSLDFQCFEVQRPVYYQLCGNIVLNGLGNVQAHQIGIGEKKGECEVALPDYISDINIGGFSLNETIRNNIHGGARKGETVNIRIINLDSLYLENVRLIKVDVEGMELEVLRGAAGTLIRNSFPPIIFEAWNFDWYAAKKNEIFKYLSDFGYQIFNFDGSENYIAQHHSNGPFINQRWT